MDLVYTLVLHPIRRELGLTFTQFAIADSVYHLSHGGWCIASRQYLARTFDVDKRTIQRNLQVLEEKGLIERNAETDYLRTTEAWRFAVVMRSGQVIAEASGGGGQNATPRGKTPPPPWHNATPPHGKMPPNNNTVYNNSYTHKEEAVADPKIVPPLREWVLDFFKTLATEKGFDATEGADQADQFYDHHAQSNWMLSAGRGAKMKDWQSAGRNWFRNYINYYRGKKKAPAPAGKAQAQGNFTSTLFDMEKGGNG